MLVSYVPNNEEVYDKKSESLFSQRIVFGLFANNSNDLLISSNYVIGIFLQCRFERLHLMNSDSVILDVSFFSRRLFSDGAKMLLVEIAIDCKI